MARVARRPGLLIVCAALSLTGCASTVVGHAGPGVPASAGPLARVQQTVDLAKGAGDTTALSFKVAADGVGGVVALPDDLGDPSRLVHYAPAGGRFRGDHGQLLKQVDSAQELFAGPSGRVVVVGTIEPPDGYAVFGALVLEPGQDQGKVIDLMPNEAERWEDEYSVLTPDGKTLYELLEYDHADDVTRMRLLTVDLDRGRIRAQRDLPELARFGSLAEALNLTPDGRALVLGVQLFDESQEHGKKHAAVLRFTTGDLSPAGDPVSLSKPEEKLELAAMGTAADGTVAALLDDYPSGSRLVALDPGSSSPRTVLRTDDNLVDTVALDAAGRWAGLMDSHYRSVSVDLRSGKRAHPVQLCDGVSEPDVNDVVPGSHGSTLLVTGSCKKGEDYTLWVVGPAG